MNYSLNQTLSQLLSNVDSFHNFASCLLYVIVEKELDSLLSGQLASALATILDLSFETMLISIKDTKHLNPIKLQHLYPLVAVLEDGFVDTFYQVDVAHDQLYSLFPVHLRDPFACQRLHGTCDGAEDERAQNGLAIEHSLVNPDVRVDACHLAFKARDVFLCGVLFQIGKKISDAHLN